MTAQFGRLAGRETPSIGLYADWRPRVYVLAAAVVLILAANAFAIAYVSSEHYIYYWDWAFYWLKFGEFGELARTNPLSAIAAVCSSIRYDEYNFLQLVPLVPFEIVGGPGRTSYIVAITNAAVLPAAALTALVADRLAEHRSWPRYILCVGLLLCLHPLWAPALRGFPDVIGVAVASGVLLLYFRKPVEEQQTADFVRLGIALCLIVLIRRWYIFWTAAFFPAAIFAFVAASPRGVVDRRSLLHLITGLATAGIACAVFLLLLAGPLVIRAAITDYSVAFAAYRSSFGPADQVVAHFGLALIALALAGVARLIASRRTRGAGILIVTQAALSLALFAHVQEFLGVQHYYILVPALGIGIAAAVQTVWDAKLQPTWRAAGMGSIFAIILLSALAAFSPAGTGTGLLLPTEKYPPLVRPDLREVDRLLDALAELKPHRVYVAASSEVLNWSTLKMRCRDRHPELCTHIAITSDIDTRDGFPVGMIGADYAVLATPIQYHVSPKDQQVVGLVAHDLASGQGIGRSFQPLGDEFLLKDGVRAQIYRRIAPIRESDLEALSATLDRSYPGVDIFRYPLR